MNRAMLAVDWHKSCPRNRSQWLHDWTCSDEAFFVGKTKAFALTQCLQRDWQTSESDDTVHDDISDINNGDEIVNDANIR